MLILTYAIGRFLSDDKVKEAWYNNSDILVAEIINNYWPAYLFSRVEKL